MAGPGVFGGESACFRMQMLDKRNKRRWNPKSRFTTALFTSLLKNSKYLVANPLFVLHVMEENKCVQNRVVFCTEASINKRKESMSVKGRIAQLYSSKTRRVNLLWILAQVWILFSSSW